MSRKLVPQPGQQGLEGYINSTPKSTNAKDREPATVKKRTPPSTERPTKRRGYSVGDMEEQQEMKTTLQTDPSQDQIEQQEAARKAKIYSHFTPEMIACLKEVIKEIQQPMEKKLDTLIEIQTKQTEQDEDLRELKKEQNTLKRKFEKTEHENDHL